MKVEELDRHCESIEARGYQNCALDISLLVMLYSGMKLCVKLNNVHESDKRKLVEMCKELIDYYAI